jgi:hypothetical protein
MTINVLTAAVATAVRPAATAAIASSSDVGIGATRITWGSAGAEAVSADAEEILRGQHVTTLWTRALPLMVESFVDNAVATTESAFGLLVTDPLCASGR